MRRLFRTTLVTVGATSLLATVALGAGSKLGERLDSDGNGGGPKTTTKVDGKLASPERFVLEVRGELEQTVRLKVSITCFRNRGFRTRFRAFSVSSPVNYPFKPTVARADDCTLTARVVHSEGGLVRTTLYGKGR